MKAQLGMKKDAKKSQNFIKLLNSGK